MRVEFHPVFVATIAIIGQAITENTAVALGLTLGGISGTAVLVWWARGEREKDRSELRRNREQLRILKTNMKRICDKIGCNFFDPGSDDEKKRAR